MLATPDVREPFGVRDRAILETLYSTGMRRMEIVGLGLTDVDLERGTVLIRQGKGGKERMVPIGDRAIAWIACHIFRHTCATLMLERGADLRSIQPMLGHEHLATTEIYTRVSIGQLKKVHAKTHPSARLGRAGAVEDGPVEEDPAEELLAALAEEEDEERDAGGELGDGDEEDG